MFNYLNADVLALFDIVGRDIHSRLCNGALLGSALLLEIPMAMIVDCFGLERNRLVDIFAAGVETLAVVLLTFVAPLATGARPPAFPEYVFFGTIEIVCTLVIMWQAWTWSGVKASS